MSQRSERKQRRDWRSGLGRRVVMIVGWLALATAVAGLAAFPALGRAEVLKMAAIAASVAVVCSGAMPELLPRRRRGKFAPLEGLRATRSKPSLVRQLLTLP